MPKDHRAIQMLRGDATLTHDELFKYADIRPADKKLSEVEASIAWGGPPVPVATRAACFRGAASGSAFLCNEAELRAYLGCLTAVSG